MHRSLLLLPLLALAACHKPADDPSRGTSITLNADNGQVAGSVDGGSGAVKIDLPGFKSEIKLPKVRLDADNFSLNGVHLYPGSTIDTVDVGNGKGVHVAFSSPASPDKVLDWFQGRLHAAGFTLRADGDTLVGTDDENKPFRMELTPNGDAGAHGTIAIGA